MIDYYNIGLEKFQVPKVCIFPSKNLNENETLEFSQNSFHFDNVSIDNENEKIIEHENLNWVDYEAWKNMLRKKSMLQNQSSSKNNQTPNITSDLLLDIKKIDNTNQNLNDGKPNNLITEDIENNKILLKTTSVFENGEKYYQKDNSNFMDTDEIIAENMLEIFNDIGRKNTVEETKDINLNYQDITNLLKDYQLENNCWDNIIIANNENVSESNPNNLSLINYEHENALEKSTTEKNICNLKSVSPKKISIFEKKNDKANAGELISINSLPVSKNDLFPTSENHNICVDEINSSIHNNSHTNLISDPILQNYSNQNNIESTHTENDFNLSNKIPELPNIRKPQISQLIANEEISILEDENYWDNNTNPFDIINHGTANDQNGIAIYHKNSNFIPRNISDKTDIISFVKSIVNHSDFFEKLYFTLNSIDRPIQMNQNNSKNKKNKFVSWSDPLVLSLLNNNDCVMECDANKQKSENILLQMTTELESDAKTETNKNDPEKKSNERSIEKKTENVINNDEKNNIFVEEKIEMQNVMNQNKCNDKKIRIDCTNKKLSDLENFKQAYKHEKYENILEKYNRIINWIKACPVDVKEIDELSDPNNVKENSEYEVPQEITSILKKHEKSIKEDALTDTINEINSFRLV